MFNSPASPIVARGSTARRLSQDDIYAWGNDHAIFISSVMSEFANERRALATAIEHEIGAQPVVFERFGGRDDEAQRAYLEGVSRSDVYVGIVGDLYGSMTGTGRSATHEEYLEAVRLGKRISAWVKAESSARQGNAKDFVEEVRVFHTTGEFTAEADLVTGVIRRLKEIAAEDISPWVKLGAVVFRANRIEEDRDTITLQASVRDLDVEQALIDLRAGEFGPQESQYSDHSSSYPVTVEDVVRSATSTAVSDVSIRLRKVPDRGAAWASRVTVQNHGPDELVEVGLRHSFLGEPLPAELAQFGSFGVPSFSLAGAEEVPADAASAVARVFLVEQLLGGGHARSVTQVLLGGGQREAPRLRVAWRSVDDGQHRAIEGDYAPT